MFFAQARELIESMNSPRMKAEIDMRQGPLLARQGRTAEAEQMFRDMLEAGQAAHSIRLEASAQGNLGWLLMRTFRYDDAIFWLERARSLFQQLGSEPDVGRAKGNLGYCYFRLGDEERALPYLKEAQKSAQAAGNHRDEHIWLGDLGSIYYDQDDFQQAAANYRQALQLARAVKDKDLAQQWAASLASTLIELGQLDEAESVNREIVQADPGAAAIAAVTTARVESLRGHEAHAVDLYRALLAHPVDNPTTSLNARSDLARLLAKMGRLDEADREFRETLAQIDSRQADLTNDDYRLSYLSNLITFCDLYVKFLVDRQEKERALEVTESIRARLLNGRASLMPASGTPASSVSAAALERAAAASGSTFLSYWLAPGQSFLWLVQGNGIEVYRLAPGRQIESSVTRYRNFLEGLKDPLASENPTGRQLAEMLLKPVRDKLKPGSKVVIAPDRNLHALNFEALPDPADPSHYLIEALRLCVAPSLTLLATQTPAAKSARGSLLLIGDPEPAGADFPRLPNAAREIELVRKTFAPTQQVVLEGKSAFPKAYLESAPDRFSTIHFAAHATANRESPLDSALILSPSDSGYMLTAREVMNKPLKAGLVTLSACRSAGAKTFSGEGLVGLSWAFFAGGGGGGDRGIVGCDRRIDRYVDGRFLFADCG